MAQSGQRPVSLKTQRVGGRTNGSRRRNLTKFKQPIKHRTVLPYVEALQLAKVFVHVVWSDRAQEVDVVITVKPCQFCSVQDWRPEYIHLLIKVVVYN